MKDGLFFLYEGGRLPVTNLFDVDGEEVSDIDKATSTVCRMPDGRWLASKCEPHDFCRGN